MAKRKIIKIDEKKCNGCGLCMPNCPEGAIRIIDGKARLVGDLFCDGLGACLGHCPEGAIKVEEREAAPYDEKKVMENIVKQGKNVIKAHLEHLRDHNESGYLASALQVLKEKNIENPLEARDGAPRGHGGGCPGSRAMEFAAETGLSAARPAGVQSSELTQWPIQLHLVNPNAPYFKDADIVVAADCVPFSFADFHGRFLKGKKLVVFCPKLDGSTDAYVEKLTDVIKNNNIKSVTAVHMEVPCCFGTLSIVRDAVKRSGKAPAVKEYNISLKGEIL
jgi:ferredoxin